MSNVITRSIARQRALYATSAQARPRTPDEKKGLAPADIIERTPTGARHLAQDAQARAAEVSLLAVAGPFFSDFRTSQPYARHIEAAKAHAVSPKLKEGVQRFRVPSTTPGDKNVHFGMVIPHLAERGKPVVIYMNEATTKAFDDNGKLLGSFASFFGNRKDITAIGVRTPGQNRGLSGAIAATSIERTKAQTAATATFIDSIVRKLREEGHGPIFVSGYSLGGAYANYYRAAFDDGKPGSGADGYIPIGSPRDMGALYDKGGWWTVMLSPDAFDNVSQVVTQLSLPNDALKLSDAKVRVLAARHDQIAQRIEDGYAPSSVRFMPGGHISGITPRAKGGTIDATSNALNNAIAELMGQNDRGAPDAHKATSKGVVDLGARFPEFAGAVVETFNPTPGILPPPGKTTIVFADMTGKAVEEAKKNGGLVIRITPPMRGENLILEREEQVVPLQVVTPERLADAMADAALSVLDGVYDDRAPALKTLAVIAEGYSAGPAQTLSAKVRSVTLIDAVTPANPFALTFVPQAQALGRQMIDQNMALFGFSGAVRAATLSALDTFGFTYPLRLGVAALDAMTSTPPKWVADAGLAQRYHAANASWIVGADKAV